ncbi:MAG: hypothetical protein PHN84_03250 [Desulfuromonadaceae bacterium]|nr:hypothetical protein [Desulfuromonadaceae bacterium]
MSEHAAHLQAILDSAIEAAKVQATSATISAVEKARRALDDYNGTANSGEKFTTQTAALEYLQRTWQIEKSKLSKDCKDGKVPRKEGLYHAKDLDFYAEAVHLKAKTSAPATISDGKDRLTMAMAEERELKLSQLRGQLIDAAEEEARDAKLWAAVKSDIENHAPAIVRELINRVLPLTEDDDLKQRILGLSHELRLTYEDAVADIFDRYATDGGIDA